MIGGWVFLLIEFWVLLVLAASFGVFAGWIIWGWPRSIAKTPPSSIAEHDENP